MAPDESQPTKTATIWRQSSCKCAVALCDCSINILSYGFATHLRHFLAGWDIVCLRTLGLCYLQQLMQLGFGDFAPLHQAAAQLQIKNSISKPVNLCTLSNVGHRAPSHEATESTPRATGQIRVRGNTAKIHPRGPSSRFSFGFNLSNLSVEFT